MSRIYTNKLLELLEEGLLTHKLVLNELLSYLSEDEVKDFCLNSFGGEGIFNEEEDEEDI